MTKTEDSTTALGPLLFEVIVNVPQAFAFEMFVKQGAWWPMESHHIGKQSAVDVIIEPRVGGRWFERLSDGTDCSWGQVLAYEPTSRMLFGWQLNSKWAYDAGFMTEVEVLFIEEGPEKTRVTLEHRNWERFGDDATRVRNAYGSENGWKSVLNLYVEKTQA